MKILDNEPRNSRVVLSRSELVGRKFKCPTCKCTLEIEEKDLDEIVEDEEVGCMYVECERCGGSVYVGDCPKVTDKVAQ